MSGHHKLSRRNKLTLHHFRAMLYSLASEILEFSLCILRVHNSSDHEIVEHHAGSSPLLQTAHIACLSFYSLAKRLLYSSYSAAFLARSHQEASLLVLEPLLGLFLKSSWCSYHCPWSSRRQVKFILIRTLKRITEGTRLMVGPNRGRAQRRFKMTTRMVRSLMFGSAQRSLKLATMMERRLTKREGRRVRLEEVDGW